MLDRTMSRRDWLATALAGGAACLSSRLMAAAPSDKARIAITLDLEMSAEYPVAGMTEWNFQKGNLDQATKDYAVEAGQIVRERGAVLHYFCVARVLEQPDVTWLQGLAEAGHPIGNHTYDHVYVLAQTPEEVQFRFRRSPWLTAGETPAETIERNIRLAAIALKERAGIVENGFRTPGGFATALNGRPDVQQMLQGLGYTWVSSLYPPTTMPERGTAPTEATWQSLYEALPRAQPFVYPTGLVEVPMSPISDVNAFRSSKWKLDWFLEAIERAVTWAIEHRAVFDFLAHPSCLVVEDPEFRSIRKILDLVERAGDKAEIVGLDRIAAPFIKSNA